MEPLVERVVEKLRANFCDLFEPNPKPAASTAAPDAEALRKAAEALFGQ